MEVKPEIIRINSNLKVIEFFFESDLCLKTRTIYIGGNSCDDEIDARIAENAIKAMHLLNQDEEEITILLSCKGGDFYNGIAIYDAIKTSPCYVTIIAYGQCMSMGSIILQAGDTRVMSPNATMMIHSGFGEASGNMQEMMSLAEHNRKTLDMMFEIYSWKSKLSKTKLTEFLQNDTYLTAQEAVEMGLADKILGED